MAIMDSCLLMKPKFNTNVLCTFQHFKLSELMLNLSALYKLLA